MFSVCGCVRLNERLIECLMYVCVHLRESERERKRLGTDLQYMCIHCNEREIECSAYMCVHLSETERGRGLENKGFCKLKTDRRLNSGNQYSTNFSISAKNEKN